MQPKHTEPLFIPAAAAGLLQGHDPEGDEEPAHLGHTAWRQNQTPVYFHCTGNGNCNGSIQILYI